MHILVTRSGSNSDISFLDHKILPNDNIGILWNHYLFNSKLCEDFMGRDNYLLRNIFNKMDSACLYFFY